MIINDIFAQFDIKSNIGDDLSIHNKYDRVIELVSLAFTSDELSPSQKKELYMDIASLYGQLDTNL